MVTYSKEAKIVVLAGLFHDVGKFYQRCVDTREKHQDFGSKYLGDIKEYFLPVFDNEESEFEKFMLCVKNHHAKTEDYLTKLIRTGDSLSASQRVDMENEKEFEGKWSHKFLSSVFSKIQITSEEKTPLKYFKHEKLTNRNYDALIPVFDNENEAKSAGYKYTDSIWKEFNDDLVSVLKSFGGSGDFDTLVNLMLVLFEKYMWCIPDFTGSSETDISLFNHLKDTAAFAHAIYLSETENPDNRHLNIICGDIPGIQNYIFDVTKTKAAKMLRGRSIFVQVLSRIFASKFLEAFGLSECSLIMLAGGKFYILAPSTGDFESVFNKTKDNIEKYLAGNFNYELKFNAASEEFSHSDLLNGKISFGRIVENVNNELNNAKNRLFENILFSGQGNFIIQDDFIQDSEDSNNVKCYLTEKPIFTKQAQKFEDRQEDGSAKTYNVNRQAMCEYRLGEKVTKNNTIIDYMDFEIIPDLIMEFGNYDGNKNAPKILINPDIDELLASDKRNKLGLILNTRFIEVANYVSKDRSGFTMDFEEMAENSEGAKYLCLIKGDIDNLGLIMAYGLDRDASSYTGISRITTMSNHLKYFFSFFLNGLLKDLSERKERKESKIYTVFAGGDDLMLVATQSYALELIKTFNEKFSSFTCENNEIHITYSVTHFKPSTPVRIISEMSENNQKNAKSFREIKIKGTETKISGKHFLESENKSSIFYFDTIIKNSGIDRIISLSSKLVAWCSSDSDKNKLSMSVLRNLFTYSDMMKSYRNGGDARNLIWHPMLTYAINRNLKDKTGDYRNMEAGEFFESVLRINKDADSKNLEEILFPAVCDAIYKLRNN